MKKLVILLVSVIVLSSCEKTVNELSELFPEMSATVDGESWKSITRKTNKTDEGFLVTGISATGETIVLNIQGLTTGTYNIVDVPPGLYAGYNETEIEDPTKLTNAYVAYTGSVNLTEVDATKKTISGTFSFTATKVSTNVVITNGVFKDIKYTEQ